MNKYSAIIGALAIFVSLPASAHPSDQCGPSTFGYFHFDRTSPDSEYELFTFDRQSRVQIHTLNEEASGGWELTYNDDIGVKRRNIRPGSSIIISASWAKVKGFSYRGTLSGCFRILE